MKNIDIKSLLLGAALSILFLTLTSSKTSSENNTLEVFARAGQIDIFNKQTNTIYEYHGTSKGKISEKPNCIYKVAADGSSTTSN